MTTPREVFDEVIHFFSLPEPRNLLATAHARVDAHAIETRIWNPIADEVSTILADNEAMCLEYNSLLSSDGVTPSACITQHFDSQGRATTFTEQDGHDVALRMVLAPIIDSLKTGISRLQGLNEAAIKTKIRAVEAHDILVYQLKCLQDLQEIAELEEGLDQGFTQEQMDSLIETYTWFVNRFENVVTGARQAERIVILLGTVWETKERAVKEQFKEIEGKRIFVGKPLPVQSRIEVPEKYWAHEVAQRKKKKKAKGKETPLPAEELYYVSPGLSSCSRFDYD